MRSSTTKYSLGTPYSNEAVTRDPTAEITRIRDELTACGLPPKPVNATEIQIFFDADLMHSNKESKTLASNECIIPPLEQDLLTNGDRELEQVYVKAMTVFCDLKNGKALEPDYVWPLLSY